MKSLIISAILVFCAASVPAADTPTMTGTWKIHSSVAGNDSDTVCTLTQTGNDIAGTCKTTDGTDAKATGKVDGNKVTWQFDSDYNGTALTIKYTATADPNTDKLSGTVSVDPFGVEGDFTATAAK